MGKHGAEGTLVPSVQVRKWLYGIASAVVPLLVLLGLVADDVAQAILTVAAAALAVGSSALAGVNVRNPGDES